MPSTNRDGKVDICVTSPGREVDVFFSTTARTMSEVWMGERSYREAVLSGDLIIEGDLGLTRRISSWLGPSIFVNAKGAPVAGIHSGKPVSV
jgi:hypothetical protein